VKPDVDTLATVPAAPPEAGPDRALDAPPPDPRPPAAPLPAAEEGVAGAADVPQAESPITAHIGAAAMIHRLFLFDSNRRIAGRRSRSAMVTVAEVAFETRRCGTVA